MSTWAGNVRACNRRGICVVLTAALSLCVVILLSSASASTSPRFRLAHHTSVRLASGGLVHGRFRWKVSVSRPADGPQPRLRPCISVSLRAAGNPGPEGVSIDDTECRRPIVFFPNILASVDELHKPTMTVIGMALVRRAATVRLYFDGPARARTIRLRTLSRNQQLRMGLAPYSYAGLAFAGNSCVSRFIVRDSAGKIIDDGGRMRCRS